MTNEQRELSNHFYEWAMLLTDSGAKNVDKFIEILCKQEGINYPPQQLEKANQQPINAGI